MHMRAQTNLSVAVHAPVLALLRSAAEEWPIACDSASSRDVGGVTREVAESLQRHTAVGTRCSIGGCAARHCPSGRSMRAHRNACESLHGVGQRLCGGLDAGAMKAWSAGSFDADDACSTAADNKAGCGRGARRTLTLWSQWAQSGTP